MRFIRNILIVFVPVYYLITSIRNWLYDNGFFKPSEFNIPVICVGNLTVGGTGKTPMIEYLIRILKDQTRVITLSRGYGRTSRGFILGDKTSDAGQLGDEPYQIFRKFPDITVSVDSNRKRGIENLIQGNDKSAVVLLDDAFQHRKVKAGLNILLTPFHDLYTDDMLLPTGNLRESKSGASRAQIIVVTKCPEDISDTEKEKIKKQLNPKPGQLLFFSTISYSSSVIGCSGKTLLEAWGREPFTLVTGIADPSPLIAYLKSMDFKFDHLKFRDHHRFSASDIERIKSLPRVLTTEKDYVRLGDQKELTNLWYLGVEANLIESEKFNEVVLDYVVR